MSIQIAWDWIFPSPARFDAALDRVWFRWFRERKTWQEIRPVATPQEQKMAIGKFEIFQGKNKQWFFRLKSPNGKVICQSEGYKAKKSCYKGIAAVRWVSEVARTVEV